MQYVGISTYQFIPYYASARHKRTHTCILKSFEDSKPMGLKVDIAGMTGSLFGQTNFVGQQTDFLAKANFVG